MTTVKANATPLSGRRPCNEKMKMKKEKQGQKYTHPDNLNRFKNVQEWCQKYDGTEI